MNKDRWQFLKHIIDGNITADQREKIFIQDRILLSTMHNNTMIHHIASQIARRILDDGLLDENATDAFGGFLPHGLIMRHHGGLFKLSIDRLVNNSGGEYCIHFPDPNIYMANIRLVPLAINLGKCGAFSLSMVHEAVGQPVDVASLLDYESATDRKSYGNTTLYRCCHHTFAKDERLETLSEVETQCGSGRERVYKT